MIAFGQSDATRTTAKPSAPVEAVQSVTLKLSDGTKLAVDEAWESEQGIWYRRGGLSHLISKDRVKKIERISESGSQDGPSPAKSNRQSARMEYVDQPEPEQPEPSPTGTIDQPVWIYLKGGARFEADSLTESAAGAWYRRGSMAVFVERARIDHIEREEVESLGESDSSSRKARRWSTGNAHLDALIKQNGFKYGVDPYLIFCVMEQESHFNARALSPKGARGLMQLMPGTAARFGIRRASDPAQNIAGGTRYLKQLINQFNGKIDLVLASYNAGEGAVLKFGRRVPPYRETRDYVRKIGYRYRRAKPVTPAKGEVAAVGGGL